MTNIILVTSGKGGAGKSTVSVALGRSFAAIGRKTVIVELDVGLRGLDLMLGVEDRAIYDLGDLLASRCSINDAVIPVDREGNLAVIVAPSSLTDVIDYDDVALLCKGLTDYFDHVIIDAPAGIGVSVLLAPKVADMVLVVATPDSVCVRDGGRLAALLSEHGAPNIRLVINKINVKQIKAQEIKDMDQVIDGVGAQLIGTVPLDGELASGRLDGDLKGKSRVCGQIFENIAYRILGEDVELLIQ